MDDQRLLDDVFGAHAGIEGGVRILENDLHVAAGESHAARGVLEHVLAPKQDLAAVWFDEAKDAAAGRALAASGLANQAEHISFFDTEADVVHCAHDGWWWSEETAAAREVFDEATYVEQRHQRRPIPGTALSRRRVYSCDGARRI